MSVDSSASRRPAAHRLAGRLEQLTALDRPAEAVAGAFRGLLKPGRAKDALSGSWLGHALHPLLTDVPIGAWTSATLLDALGRDDDRPAAKRLVAVGIASAVPTAVSGMSDWSDTTLSDPAARRVGAVHAVANVAALAFYS
ncbi:MAG: (2Fe-2S)-binding protein, partial [Actinomycetota bacterium]|nr:(2Fe-2S)-binding protein [Actinomycetota bacterium]